MSGKAEVSKMRHLGEIILVMVAYFIFSVVLASLFYFADAGFTMDAALALQAPGGEKLLLGPAFLSLPLAMVLTILVIFGLQKLRGEGLSELGLKRPASWPKAGLIGIGLAAFILVLGVALQYVLSSFGLEPDSSDFEILMADPLMFIYGLTAISWFAAAFGEEILFRGFLMRCFYRLFGGTNIAAGFAVVSQALIFASLHLNQAVAGVIAAFIIAIVFGAAFYKMGRNLWLLIIAHGVYDNAALLLMYFGVDG
jgi:hypothetical protein